MEERIQKLISQWGVASRRQAEAMIRQGRVRCNGAVIVLGQKADPLIDTITVDGQRIQPRSRPQPVYLLLNKPAGVVSTCNDPQGRRTVMDLLSPELRVGQGIHPVGRLDAYSTGALLLTNDGDLTLALTHPRHNITKTYHVWVEGHPSASVLQQWRRGVVLDDKKTRQAGIRVLSQNSAQTCLEVVLKEGRNRQIRRIAEQLGYPVRQLKRTAIGAIKLQSPPLPEGSYRPLTSFELRFLRDQIDRTCFEESGAIKE